jgi:hypothetical protein
MHNQSLKKAGILAIALTAIFMLSWELLLRSKGFQPTFNDDKALWADKRKEVYQAQNNATVFIGSSRIKFGLDIATWEQLTGEKAVQLALVGTSPQAVLKDLAEDEQFKGKLIIDITEPIAFSHNPFFQKRANEALAFYKKQTPSEKLSAGINFAAESSLALLEENRFSRNTLLGDLNIPNRPGVFSMPSFPKSFDWVNRERQSYLSQMFLSNPQDIKQQTDIWKLLVMGDPTPPMNDTVLQAVFADIKNSINKIHSRGGKVVFVRTPSSGFMGDGEAKFFPREKFWNPLLKSIGVQGLHYKDDPVTAKLICPEWSHLSPQDAIIYTQRLVAQLQQKGWFNNAVAQTSTN